MDLIQICINTLKFVQKYTSVYHLYNQTTFSPELKIHKGKLHREDQFEITSMKFSQ